MLRPTDIPAVHRQLYKLGRELVADKPQPAYDLAGHLHITRFKDRPWGLLTVPNALVRGVYAAIDEPGVELPPGRDGQLQAHITVFRPEDIERIGGPDRLRERGHRFRYTLGRLVKFRPHGWPEMADCWVIRVHSPQLQELRRTYGLSSLPNDGKFDFHITVAVRRHGITGRNNKSVVEPSVNS